MDRQVSPAVVVVVLIIIVLVLVLGWYLVYGDSASDTITCVRCGGDGKIARPRLHERRESPPSRPAASTIGKEMGE